MQKRLLATTCVLATLSTLCADDLPPSSQGREAIGMVNPSSRFQVENGWNMFLNIEFLWWVAKPDGLYYAQSGYTHIPTTAIPPTGVPDFNGHLEKVTPNWTPGFRIGLGGNMEYDEWDIFLNWTWFKSTGRDSSHGFLLVLWGHPDIDTPTSSANGALSATAKYHLQLDTVDLEMGRSFWVGKYFSLRPFICARGAWIHQNFGAKYHLATTPMTHSKFIAHSIFEGGGVRAGFDARFSLLGGWSFYGLASASMLYGHYDCFYRGKWESKTIATTHDGFHRAASSGQLALGVRWDTYVHRDRYHFGLYAGWEQNIWFGLNKMNHWIGKYIDGNLQQMTGNLNLQGGTFGVRFDY